MRRELPAKKFASFLLNVSKPLRVSAEIIPARFLFLKSTTTNTSYDPHNKSHKPRSFWPACIGKRL